MWSVNADQTEQHGLNSLNIHVNLQNMKWLGGIEGQILLTFLRRALYRAKVLLYSGAA